MKDLLKKLKIYGYKKIINYILIDLYRKLWMQFVRGSYSQLGEDLIIDKFLNYKKSGFYIDIGAYDPDRFSNTKRFYLRGWKGINIEPNIINYKKFLNVRKKDINLNIGIGNHNSKLLFYEFIPDTLSTFSTTEAIKYQKQGYYLVNKKAVQVKKLSTVLKKIHNHKNIDFFSIDTEGLDYQVLLGNNWNKYSPNLICIESTPHSIEKSEKKINKIEILLKKKGYRKIYDNYTNSIYLKNKINKSFKNP